MEALGTAAVRADLVEPCSVEREVLRRLLDGLSNRAICDELGIDADRLKAITRAVVKRLGAESREQLVALSTILIKRSSKVA
jgi:DNA-binding CsgD family transcriptional regulator